MTNKVEYDNSKIKLFQTMADMEDFMAAELEDDSSRYKARSEQRVLEKYKENSLNLETWNFLSAIFLNEVYIYTIHRS